MSNIAKQKKKSVNALLHAEFKRIKKLALSALADGVQPSAFGICVMMKGDLRRIFEGDNTIDTPRGKAFNAWPKSSGCITFPILVMHVPKGCNKEDAAADEYGNSRGMRWAGKQLEARLDLLDHLIEYFKPPVLPRTSLLKILRVDMQADGYNHDYGICGALDFHKDLEPKSVYAVVREARYALSPGCALYPIPCKGMKNAGAFYMHSKAGTLWVGEYGAARKAYALLLADYIAANYTVHLNPIKQSKVQETFRKVIDAGYYQFRDNTAKGSRYMCHALDYANRDGVISSKEKEEASAAIKEYMVNPHDTRVMINVLYYAGIVKDSLYMGKNIQVLVKLYTNWDKRPKLVF